MLRETRCAIRCRSSWMYALWVCTFLMVAVAETPPQHPSELIVKYSDLDLTHMSGIVELYRRLVQAARLVCTAVTAETGTAPSAVCVSDALARAVSEINEPALTSYAAAHAAPSHPPE
jgi:UrcA family protein